MSKGRGPELYLVTLLVAAGLFCQGVVHGDETAISKDTEEATSGCPGAPECADIEAATDEPTASGQPENTAQEKTAQSEEIPVPDAPASLCFDDAGCGAADESGNKKPNWIDARHRYVSNKADELAVWMDKFFGVRRTDLEAAHSSLRLRGEVQWDAPMRT